MYLAVRPVWSNREPTTEEIKVTNTLYQIYQRVVTNRRLLAQQVDSVRTARGTQKIASFTGNIIDDIFKEQVLKAKARGEIPRDVHVTPKGIKGPDVWWERVAWDITTAEQGRSHVERDVFRDPYRWDLYFVLGY